MTGGRIDLESPDIFHNESFFSNPHETFARLRAAGPVVRVNFWGGLHYVGGYQEIVDSIGDRRLSHDLSGFWASQFRPEQNAQLGEFARIFGLWMAHYDGPRHTRLRGILNRALSRAIQITEARIREVIVRHAADLPEGSVVDLIRDFAYPLPALVTAALLDIAHDKFDLFMACADNLVEMTGSTRADFDLALRTQASMIALTRHLEELIEARRSKPGDDLISLMIAEAGRDEALTDAEIHGQCTMMLFAGHETTRNLIGNGVFLLLAHSEQLALVRREPSALRRAIEEILRYESPVQLTVRAVSEDFDLLGVRVRAGEHVMFNYGSANRDERKFKEPGRFDIERNDEHNVSFGVGPHTCVGARLAVMEGQRAFGALLDRFSRLELVDAEPRWHHNAGFRGLKTLHVIGR